MPKVMRKVLIILFLISTFHVNTAFAYWEEYDVYGKYMFGYAGIEDNLSLYFPEVQSNRIPTNTHTLVV